MYLNDGQLKNEVYCVNLCMAVSTSRVGVSVLLVLVEKKCHTSSTGKFALPSHSLVVGETSAAKVILIN